MPEIVSIGNIWILIGFNVFVLLMLALDLGVFHKDDHVVSVKESLVWTGVWIALALAFAGVVYYFFGYKPMMEYLAGYILEKSLSVDNIFVFIMVFSFFSVPREYQHRVLFWGILTALVLRGVFILAGAALLSAFHWIIYVFGVVVLYTGFKMLLTKEDHKFDPGKSLIVKFTRKFFHISEKYHGHDFFVWENGKLHATLLFMVLVIIEFVDVIFAFDSIPAIFGITKDPFIVYTSNVFAILGLRALYFAMAGIITLFKYLGQGVALVLIFIGVKMMSEEFVHIPIVLSLGIIGSILLGSVLLSIVVARRQTSDPKK